MRKAYRTPSADLDMTVVREIHHGRRFVEPGQAGRSWEMQRQLPPVLGSQSARAGSVPRPADARLTCELGATAGTLTLEPVVVVEPTEDGQGDERALGAWRGPEFGVRGWDRVNRLRGPRAVVAGDVGVHDPPEVRDA